MSTRARTFVAAGLSELSQKIEQIGRNLFLNGALVDGSERRSDFPARRRHLFGLLFAGLDEGGLIGFAPAIGALLNYACQNPLLIILGGDPNGHWTIYTGVFSSERQRLIPLTDS